jgi:hypothetical protein
MNTNDLLTLVGNHPVLTFFSLPFLTVIVLVIIQVIVGLITLPFRIVNRVMRHWNIHKHGYPPPHCDADGDFEKEEI